MPVLQNLMEETVLKAIEEFMGKESMLPEQCRLDVPAIAQ